MSSAIARTDALPLAQMHDSKNVKHRLQHYEAWTQVQGVNWLVSPALADYRDVLQTKSLSPASINAHLSTVRGRIKAMLETSEYRDYLYSLAPVDATASDRKAFVDETITRMYAAINPNRSSVKVISKQDSPDDETGIRLTSAQANELLKLPDLRTKQGLRDLALIAFALCTGLRESELTALDVSDLRQRLRGELAVNVRKGKGSKQRLVPYGSLSWCLAIVDAWTKAACISEGAVFRSFRKGDKVSYRRLSVRAIEDIVKRYCIYISGECVTIAPHDLRRSYAAICYYELGMDIVSIQHNLGHSDHKTTLRYIGAGTASDRAPQRNPFVFDTNLLRGVA